MNHPSTSSVKPQVASEDSRLNQDDPRNRVVRQDKNGTAAVAVIHIKAEHEYDIEDQDGQEPQADDRVYKDEALSGKVPLDGFGEEVSRSPDNGGA